jgi:amidase
MRAAGAIVIGRTNLPDMGLRMHTASSLHGATINPWDPARTPGGSSGGDACAVAAGIAALALGNDLGGSLRNPAHACGVASIRPTAGRVPDAGLVPAPDRLLVRQLMMVQGPIARRVADLRLALRVLAGAHPRDPWSMDMPFEVPRPAGPLRIAVLEDPPGGTTQPAVRAAVRRAADALADAGCVVAAACPPRYAEAVELWASIVAADFAGVVPLLRPLMGAEAAACSDGFMAAVPAAGDAAAVSRLWTQRDGVAREWSVFMAEWPLLLSPTWSDLPPAPGFDTGGAAGARAATELVRAVTPANLLGLPSACVPAGLDPATGLPVGVLLTGARGADALCLDAAEVVERRWPVDTPIDPLR